MASFGLPDIEELARQRRADSIQLQNAPNVRTAAGLQLAGAGDLSVEEIVSASQQIGTDIGEGGGELPMPDFKLEDAVLAVASFTPLAALAAAARKAGAGEGSGNQTGLAQLGPEGRISTGDIPAFGGKATGSLPAIATALTTGLAGGGGAAAGAGAGAVEGIAGGLTAGLGESLTGVAPGAASGAVGDAIGGAIGEATLGTAIPGIPAGLEVGAAAPGLLQKIASPIEDYLSGGGTAGLIDDAVGGIVDKLPEAAQAPARALLGGKEAAAGVLRDVSAGTPFEGPARAIEAATGGLDGIVSGLSEVSEDTLFETPAEVIESTVALTQGRLPDALVAQAGRESLDQEPSFDSTEGALRPRPELSGIEEAGVHVNNFVNLLRGRGRMETVSEVEGRIERIQLENDLRRAAFLGGEQDKLASELMRGNLLRGTPEGAKIEAQAWLRAESTLGTNHMENMGLVKEAFPLNGTVPTSMLIRADPGLKELLVNDPAAASKRMASLDHAQKVSTLFLAEHATENRNKIGAGIKFLSDPANGHAEAFNRDLESDGGLTIEELDTWNGVLPLAMQLIPGMSTQLAGNPPAAESLGLVFPSSELSMRREAAQDRLAAKQRTITEFDPVKGVMVTRTVTDTRDPVELRKMNDMIRGSASALSTIIRAKEIINPRMFSIPLRGLDFIDRLGINWRTSGKFSGVEIARAERYALSIQNATTQLFQLIKSLQPSDRVSDKDIDRMMKIAGGIGTMSELLSGASSFVGARAKLQELTRELTAKIITTDADLQNQDVVAPLAVHTVLKDFDDTIEASLDLAIRLTKDGIAPDEAMQQALDIAQDVINEKYPSRDIDVMDIIDPFALTNILNVLEPDDDLRGWGADQ